MPGEAASGEITPEGNLYTGWAEYDLSVGATLRPWNQPTRTLPNPHLPLLSGSLSDEGIDYTVTYFAVPVEGRPVAYESVLARNDSRGRRRAKVALAVDYAQGEPVASFGGPTTAFRFARPVAATELGPYEQPGQPFSEGFSYAFAGRDLERSGLLLARGPRARARALPTPAEPSAPAAQHDERVFSVALAPQQQVRFTWEIPLEPPPVSEAADRALDKAPYRQARLALSSIWRGQERQMMRISVPEPKVTATYDASIVEMLVSRIQTEEGWMQVPNRLQYQAFWIRDAAIASDALDLAGLHLPAAQDLSFIGAFQRPDGLFVSQADQYDALGQAMWAIGEHALLTRDPGYASAELPALSAAVGWLQRETTTDPLDLLPAAALNDNELATAHITGDDLWAVDGLIAAVATARLAEDQALAASWQQVKERFSVSLDDAIDAAVARVGHIPPTLDGTGGQDWGNYGAAYPEEALGASSPEVAATLAWAAQHSIDGLPTYTGGHQLQDYLGFRLFETELEAGHRTAAVAGLYDELTHTTASDGGWELIGAPPDPRASRTDLAPHGTFAAEYVALLRNMLVREVSGGSIELLSGASPAWLAPGDHVTVAEAPTVDGSLSFTERSSRHGERLSWNDDLESGARLLWMLPPWASHVRLGDRRVGRMIALHGPAGALAVSFRGHRPSQSYERAVGRLDAAYRARGEAAPLVPSRTVIGAGTGRGNRE